MFIKTFVLDGDKSVGQIRGNILHAHRNPVGAFRIQFGDLIPFCVIDEGGKSGRGHIDVGHVRNRRKDPLHKAQSAADTDHTDGENKEQKHFKKAKSKPVAPFF